MYACHIWVMFHIRNMEYDSNMTCIHTYIYKIKTKYDIHTIWLIYDIRMTYDTQIICYKKYGIGPMYDVYLWNKDKIRHTHNMTNIWYTYDIWHTNNLW
jgi:hypothetical protein